VNGLSRQLPCLNAELQFQFQLAIGFRCVSFMDFANLSRLSSPNQLFTFFCSSVFYSRGPAHFSLCSVHHFLAKRNELIPITRIKGNACCRSVKIHKFTDPSVDSRSWCQSLSFAKEDGLQLILLLATNVPFVLFDFATPTPGK